MDLHGVRILVTRPAEQSRDMVHEIGTRGGVPVTAPMIRILPPLSWVECDACIAGLGDFAGIVFSSANAVRLFLHRCTAAGSNAALLQRAKIYVVGTKTAAALVASGLTPAFVPDVHNGAELADHFRSQDLSGLRFLLPRGDLGRPEIAEGLRMCGARVVDLIVYRTAGPDAAAATVVRKVLDDRAVDVATFASPSALEHFAAIVNPQQRETVRTTVVLGVIGETTAAAAARLGMPADVVAQKATGKGLIDALHEWNGTLKRTP